MIMIRKLLSTVLLLLSYLFWGLGDMCMAGNISFSPVFPRNEYFSDRIVVDLLRDRRGYLWIGTLDGLLLYNGSGFKCFTRDDLHTGSSAISSIFEDSRGNVWVGTEGGLCMYSMETDTFVPIDTAAQDEARIDTKVGCIREDSSGIIWFSVKSKGLWSYDPRSCAFRQYLCDGKNGVTAPKINSFVIDGNGSFIISVYCGGLLFCRDNFRSVEPLEIPLFDFSSDNFPQLLTDGRNCVYGWSRGYGLSLHIEGQCPDSSGQWGSAQWTLHGSFTPPYLHGNLTRTLYLQLGYGRKGAA